MEKFDGYSDCDFEFRGGAWCVPRASRVCSMSRMTFEQLGNDGAARRGRLTFPRGSVETPAFMPVGTYGTVKAMLPRDLADSGA